MQGGTVLTIDGVNLGKSYSDIRDRVKIWYDSVRSVDCKVNETLPHNSRKIRCTTSEATAGSGQVKVQIKDEDYSAVSKKEFSFYVSHPRSLLLLLGNAWRR